MNKLSCYEPKLKEHYIFCDKPSMYNPHTLRNLSPTIPNHRGRATEKKGENNAGASSSSSKRKRCGKPDMDSIFMEWIAQQMECGQSY